MAENDLVDVAAWYVERHPRGEQRFFEAFAALRELLAEHPLIGRERPELRTGLRSWPVHPYAVFYDVDDRSRTVTIERVIHGHMDIDDVDFGS